MKCPMCGQENAASERACSRCQLVLVKPKRPVFAPPLEPPPPPPPPRWERERGERRTFLVNALAVLLVCAVFVVGVAWWKEREAEIAAREKAALADRAKEAASREQAEVAALYSGLAAKIDRACAILKTNSRVPTPCLVGKAMVVSYESRTLDRSMEALAVEARARTPDEIRSLVVVSRRREPLEHDEGFTVTASTVFGYTVDLEAGTFSMTRIEGPHALTVQPEGGFISADVPERVIDAWVRALNRKDEGE